MTNWRARQRLLFDTAAAHLALFAVLGVAALLDPTEVTGLNRWIKPMKFDLSIAIYLATMTWFWPLAAAGERAKRRAAWLLAGTLVLETLVITGQAARGVRSHFNVTSLVDGLLFQLMGVAILINIGTAAVFLRWTFRTAGDAYVWGVRAGLALFVVFALEGGLMAQRLAHSVGVADGGPGLPFLNWSRTGGDLRVAHFVGMHALQGLPVIGAVTGRMWAVGLAGLAWGAIGVWAFMEAMAGRALGMP